jgi:hypothetical protein
MNRRYSVFFSNLALLIFLFAMFSSNVTVALADRALAFVGWLHGVFASARAERWGWLAAMLGAGALFLLAWLQSDARHVQLGFLQLVFLYQTDAPVLLWTLPGLLLAPTVLYAIVARGHAHSESAALGSADSPSAGMRRALAMGSAHPEVLSGGLILLGLVVIIATMRFGYNGMNVRFYF